jgi:steroid delta-isomerase-like uncharacterized protein
MSMSVEENKAIIRRLVEEGLNGSNIALIKECRVADYVYHNPGGIETRGLQDLEKRLAAMGTAFPDLHIEIEDIFGEGDKVAARLKTSGTFLGKFREIEPNGKSFQTRASMFYRFGNGKIVEEFEYMTEPNFFDQVGITWRPAKG